MPIVYVTTNLINGKKYLGKHHDASAWYLGSGVAITKAIKKYGKKNFTKEIIYECESLEDASNKERELSFLWNVVDDPNWYNLIPGGIWGSNKDRHVSEETRKKISINKKGKFSWNANLFGDPRLKHSEEWKKNHSNKLKGTNYNNQGDKHSSSKTVIFIDPNGIEHTVTGIRQFCRNNNLNFNIMIGRLRKGKINLMTKKHPWRIRYA